MTTSYRASGDDDTSVEVSLIDPDARIWEVVVERPPSRFSRLIAELSRLGPLRHQVSSAHRKRYEVPDPQLEEIVRVSLGESRSAEELLERIRANPGTADAD
jgi:hypothetical protein